MSPFVRTKPRLLVRGGALLGSAVVVAMVTGPTAYAASGSDGGGVKVVNTETVQVYMDADAHPTSKRVYEQLGLTGDGKVDLRNPIATRGLRNLDGFSSVDVKRGDQVVDTTVHGEKSYRTVSDYTGKLPLGVEVEYTLDGKRVQPGDVVGKSGELTVTYTITNRTAESQQVTWKDGDGNDRTTTEDVVVPMVGTLTTTVPNRFRDVSSKEANMAGDGKGGTTLSYTMTLFPPIGAPSATFGYTAKITDGVIPSAEINALPVDPLESPTFSKAAESYQGGAASGRELTEGASTIDANLLKLRDGANELLGGIVQLRDGSDQLADGLSGDAVPGAKKLDDGANVLTAGLFKLLDGTGDLSDGTGKLSAGTKKALGGGKKLSAGLKSVDDGLAVLGGQLTSTKQTDGIPRLRAGVQGLLSSLGTIDEIGKRDASGKPTTLLGGLALLKSGDGITGSPSSRGLEDARDGAQMVAGGIKQLRDGDGKDPGLAEAAGLVSGGADKLPALGAGIGSLSTFCSLIPDATLKAKCSGTVAVLEGKVDGPYDKDKEIADQSLVVQLGQLSLGLNKAVDALNGTGKYEGTGGLVNGSATLFTGLQAAVAGVDSIAASINKANVANPSDPGLRGGLLLVQGGVGQLVSGLTDAVYGGGDVKVGLKTGSGQLLAGSGTLTSGLGDLNTGARQLDAGAGKLDAGAGKAAAGSTKLSAGTAALASGLVSAGSGAEQLSAGLKKAADAAPQLPEGAQKLSTQGSKKLIEAGRDTTRTYAQNVAVIAASAERANSHSMINGAPEDASSLSAYSFKLAGADGEGSRNLVRTLGGAAVLAASGGVLLLRRRFLG